MDVLNESPNHAKRCKIAALAIIFFLPYLSDKIPAGIANTIRPSSLNDAIIAHSVDVARTPDPINMKYKAFGIHPFIEPIISTFIYTVICLCNKFIMYL